MKSKLLLYLLISGITATSRVYASDSAYAVIQVHIKHGSQPKKEYAKTEKNDLGGMLGGHVMVQIGDSVFDFAYTKYAFHLNPDKRHSIGKFRSYPLSSYKKWFGTAMVTTFYIPVSKQQYQELKSYYWSYIKKSPFDYSLLGMRCASACHYTLSKAGILKTKSYRQCVTDAFYPKQFRLYLEKEAKKHGWKTTLQKGNNRRIWEGAQQSTKTKTKK